MKLPPSIRRTFAGLLVTVLVAGILSVLAAATAQADVEVQGSATISGTLLGDGSPVTGDVNIHRVSPSGAHEPVTYAFTDGQGRWSLEVPAGDYVLLANPDDPAYLFTYFGSRTSDNMFGPGSFHVDAGETITKDIDLIPAAMVSGSVVTGGSPVEGAYVMAFAWEAARQMWVFVSDDHTRRDGTYALPARDGQQITVRVSADGFTTQFLGGGADRPSQPTATNSVIAVGRTTPLPAFSLVPLGEVTPAPEPEPVPVVEATVRIKGPRTVKASTRARITVKVQALGAKPRPAATGYVVVKMTAKSKVKGKKVRTVRVKLKNGRATIKLPRLARGRWTIRATYEGNAEIADATSKKHSLKVIASKKSKKRKAMRKR